jgi:PAS domain S-box-containing protein
VPPSMTSGSSVDTLKQRRDLLETRRELQGLRRKLERAERSLESLTGVLSLVPDPIEIVSADQTILFANHASRLLHAESTLEGTFYYRSVMGLEQPPEECPIRAAIADGYESVYSATSETGEAYLVTVTPIELSDGRRAAMSISRAAATEANRSDDTPPAADEGVPRSTETDSGGVGSGEEDAGLLRDIAELATHTLDAVLANVTDGVMIANARGEMILCNRAFREITGCAGSGPAELARILFPDRPSAETALANLGRGDLPHQAERTIFPPGGGRIPVEMTVERIDGIGGCSGVLLTLRDLREKREVQDHVIKALNFSLADERIAGLAHQVNNYLTPVFFHTGALAQRDDLDRKTRQSVTTIQNYLHLCHESILTVLSLIRPAEPTPIDMNELLSEAFSRHHLTEELRLDNIEIVQKLDPAVAPTVGYRELLQQALVNVIRNLHQAMAQAHGKGQLTVSTEAPAGVGTITIRIAGDGPGIPEENKDKIFDPMSASKPSAKGPGNGLHFTKEVIARHGGTIDVLSPPGKGATFEIRLPVKRTESPGAAGVDPA